jgi:hypothetical protein
VLVRTVAERFRGQNTSPALLLFGQRYELAERAEDNHRLAVLIFGRSFDLVAGQF